MGDGSESDTSTWGIDGEETQIIDTQFIDSPTSSPGNKYSGDEADQLNILQSTVPFEDTAMFEDELATQLMDPDGETQLVNLCDETQVVNYDTEIEEMDIIDSVERNATQLFHDSDTEEVVVTDHEGTEKTEIVDDSDEDSYRRECKEDRKEYKSKTDCGTSEYHTSGVGFKAFTSLRATSMRASGLAARKKAPQRSKSPPCSTLGSEPDTENRRILCGRSPSHTLLKHKSNNGLETGNRCGFGRSTARKLFAEDETKEADDKMDPNLPFETDLAGLSYIDSQEPGEASQANALDFVDNFLKVNIDCSDKCDTSKSSERKSKPVLSAKGIQSFAKSANLINAVGEREIFDWDDDREDEGGGEFLRRKQELLFPSGGWKLKTSSSSRSSRKLGELSGKKQLRSRETVLGLVCSDSKMVPPSGKSKDVKLQKDIVNEFDEQSKQGFEDGTTDVQETTDVRFDTQMAAEAMEDLCFGLPKTGHDSTKPNEGCNNMSKGSHKRQVHEKAPIIQSHKTPPLSKDGVRTRRSKLKEMPLKEQQDKVRAKLAAKKNALKRKEVDTRASIDQMSVKKQCIQTVIPVARRTRQSMRDNKSEKVKDASSDLTEKMNSLTGFFPKGKRTLQKLSKTRQELGCQSVSRLTRSKAAISEEHENGTCTENSGLEGVSRETIKPIHSVCTTPVSRGTPLKESSPICMGDEYLKQSWRKSRLRSSSLIQEPDSLTPTGAELTSPPKDLRKRRDTSMINVLFSRHLDGDTVKQQKKILSRLGASEASSMSDATHFIADEFVRTRNMLEAIALGKPVVTHLWLESCRQAHSHIDEKNFILRDAKKETEFGFTLPSSLARAQKHPLLKGHRVLITPNTKPGKEILESLVKAVCGVVVERLGRTAVKDDKVPEGLILSCEEDQALCMPFLEKGAAVYSSELLLNGIVTQRLEYERHRLFLNHVKRTRLKKV